MGEVADKRQSQFQLTSSFDVVFCRVETNFLEAEDSIMVLVLNKMARRKGNSAKVV